MNWYVLYTLGYKTEQIVRNLNKQEHIEAFVPLQEFYYRKAKTYQVKVMFPGYIFIRTVLDPTSFHLLLFQMGEEKHGVIRQLKKADVPALRLEEIKLFERLLDQEHVARMSEGYIENGRAVVTKGPLKLYEQHIVRIDRHNQSAWLDLMFMNRLIKVGLNITGTK